MGTEDIDLHARSRNRYMIPCTRSMCCVGLIVLSTH